MKANKPFITIVIPAIIILVAGFFICKHIKDTKELNTALLELNEHLTDEVFQYETTIHRMDSLISIYKDSIDYLIDSNVKIQSSYENKIRDFRNVSIVSDDSITRYISNKIYNR